MPTAITEPGQVTVVAPSVPWSVRHPVARRRFFPVLSAVLAIALVGTAAFFVVTTSNLNSQLADTKSQLATTQSQLATTKSQLATTQSQLTAAQSQVTTLKAQVQQQSSCIAALTADSAELSHIYDLEVANYNATATGSAWATASSAWRAAEVAANTDYYNAYLAAFRGQFTTANSWVSKANAQIDLANAANTTMNAEIASMNAANTAIEAAESTFATHLASTEATCGFGSGTSG